jgi:hypothetical protein
MNMCISNVLQVGKMNSYLAEHRPELLLELVAAGSLKPYTKPADGKTV